MSILSNRTKNPPSGRWSTTTEDMEDLFKWKIGDKVIGTHAKAFAPMARYRQDMIEGKAKARNYENNYVLINTFDKVAQQILDSK